MAEQLELDTTQTGTEGGDDIRSALTAAVDAAEKAEAPEGVQPSQSSSPPAEPDSEKDKADRAERERDEKGRFAKKQEEENAAKVEEKQEVKPPAEPVKPAVQPPAFATDGAKPPSTWKPTAREHFAKLPPEVQEEVIRIDREFHQNRREYASDRQLAQRFKETFEPYGPMLRAQNLDPFQFSANMAQTVAALANGPQQTKAEIVANVIKAYGVDIATLASILDGTPPPASQPQVYRDPRVDDLLQTVEQAKAQRNQMLAEKAEKDIKEVENEEFFWDVKDDMADLLDLAAKRNLALTPKEAYNRAVLMHPEVSKVVQQRQSALLATNPNGSTQRAKAAASSPRASPSAPASTGGERNLRDELSAAWDAAIQSR